MNRKYKCVRQLGESDCGAACLASVCQYYGGAAELSELRRLARVDRYGANLLGLRSAAEAVGFDAQGMSGSLDELFSSELTTPFIAHIISDGVLEHFVVIYELSPERVVAADPARGLVNYSRVKFAECWTGHILTLAPNRRFKRERRGKSALLSFFRLAVQNKKPFSLIALLSLLTTALSVAASFFLYALVDYIIPEARAESLWPLAAAVVAAQLLIAAFGVWRAFLSASLAKKLNLYYSQLKTESSIKCASARSARRRFESKAVARDAPHGRNTNLSFY